MFISRYIGIPSNCIPFELIRLRETWKMEFGLPEALFDMDFPGHYMRRIKTVSLSIPCVTEPHSGVSATLKLMKSRVRHTAILSNGADSYLPENEDDPRFRTYRAATRVIATSTAQNDSGLFDLNLHDERFLPFEGEGGDALGNAALNALADLQSAMTTVEGEPQPLTRLFSVRHEHYPFWAQGWLNSVVRVDLIAGSAANTTTLTVADRAVESDADAKQDILTKDASLNNLFVGKLTNCTSAGSTHRRL